MFVALSVLALLGCAEDQQACETREDALQQQRWVLECVTDETSGEVNLVASYFDPESTEDLPSGAHIYCSDRGPTFAWMPGARVSDPSSRWRDKTVTHRIDSGGRAQSRWMMSNDDGARPTYYLFGSTATMFVEELKERHELLLSTEVDYDQEPAHRLITLEGFDRVIERIPCFQE